MSHERELIQYHAGYCAADGAGRWAKGTHGLECTRIPTDSSLVLTSQIACIRGLSSHDYYRKRPLKHRLPGTQMSSWNWQKITQQSQRENM